MSRVCQLTLADAYVLNMRIAVGGIEHETNTYATDSMGVTGIDDFAISRGEQIFRHRGKRTMLGGLLAGADEAGHELVPTLWASAGPSGIVDRADYETLRDALVEQLRAAGPVDAVALTMHGAGVVDGIDDLEADLAAAVRNVIGGDVPLVVPLDLHGNITTEMGERIDLMLGVHEYPHTDSFERGIECIEALDKLVGGAWRPTTFVQHVPIMLPPSTTDAGFPAAAFRDRCRGAEVEDEVLDVTFFHGFPFTDVPATGCSIVVTTNNDRVAAERLAGELAAELWASRHDFLVESVPPATAVEVADRIATERGGPVVINDTSDNPGGGTPGDGTHLLRALIDAAPDGACFGFIVDPVVAEQARAAGPGATIEVQLGARHGELHGDPIVASAYVKTLSDGRFKHTNPMIAGVTADLGPSCRLQIGGRGGLDVIVTSARHQTFDPEVFTLHGIDVTSMRIVGLKGSQHFRAGFRDLATEIVTADSPGLTTLDVTVFAHERAPGPVWPHDPELSWSPLWRGRPGSPETDARVR